jgi:hypothetical protein
MSPYVLPDEVTIRVEALMVRDIDLAPELPPTKRWRIVLEGTEPDLRPFWMAIESVKVAKGWAEGFTLVTQEPRSMNDGPNLEA